MLDAVTLSVLLHEQGVAKKVEEVSASNLQKKMKYDGELRGLLDLEEDNASYRALFKKASSPWITKIIESHANVLTIDGWSGDDKRLWKAFLKNGWKSKQHFSITEALTYGYTYVLVLPSEDPTMAVMEPMSATNTYAVFAHSWDIYPTFAIQKIDKDHWVFIDEEAMYEITGTPSKIESLEVLEHNLGFCPVVRIDEHSCISTKLPASPFADVVNNAQALTEACFHMLHIGRKATFPRLWATGVEAEADETNEQEVGDIYATDKVEAKFGAFPQANADGIIGIVSAVQNQLAWLTKTPPHMMPSTGVVSNLSAEAITALEANHLRAAEIRKSSIGQGFNDVFRTAALVMGVEFDDENSVHWDNVQLASYSQLGDFISKVRSTGMPLEPLYQMIPGFDKELADNSAAEAYRHQSATDAGVLINLDTQRIQNAKELMALDPHLTLQEALKLAGYRTPEER